MFVRLQTGSFKVKYGIRQLFMGDGYTFPYHQSIKRNEKCKTTRLFSKWHANLDSNYQIPYVVVWIEAKPTHSRIYASNSSYESLTKDCKITYWEF